MWTGAPWAPGPVKDETETKNVSGQAKRGLGNSPRESDSVDFSSIAGASSNVRHKNIDAPLSPQRAEPKADRG